MMPSYGASGFSLKPKLLWPLVFPGNENFSKVSTPGEVGIYIYIYTSDFFSFLFNTVCQGCNIALGKGIHGEAVILEEIVVRKMRELNKKLRTAVDTQTLAVH